VPEITEMRVHPLRVARRYATYSSVDQRERSPAGAAAAPLYS
jgi:hypothetical protein